MGKIGGTALIFLENYVFYYLYFAFGIIALTDRCRIFNTFPVKTQEIIFQPAVKLAWIKTRPPLDFSLFTSAKSVGVFNFRTS